MPEPAPTPGREPQELRIGDVDRTAAADELAEHYAQGRLTTEEHHERLDRVWAARTPSDLAPLFADLPGSRYQSPRAYASADQPATGSDGTRPWSGRRPPFAGPPFGRPPFGRPPYAGPGGRGTRGAARWFGALPVLLRVLLGVVVVLVVLAHLPLILIGLLVFWVLSHKRRSLGYHRW